MSYLQFQRLSPDGGPGMHHYYTAEWLNGLDDTAIDALIGAAESAPSRQSLIVLKRMGGAVAEVPADGTAFWYRPPTTPATSSASTTTSPSRLRVSGWCDVEPRPGRPRLVHRLSTS